MKTKIKKVENLLLNMMGGLLPEDLLPNEVKLLEREYGKNWFKILGYSKSTKSDM